jgi:hypothetical protein
MDSVTYVLTAPRPNVLISIPGSENRQELGFSYPTLAARFPFEAFDRVRDVALRTVDSDHFQGPIQYLVRWPDKWLTDLSRQPPKNPRRVRF